MGEAKLPAAETGHAHNPKGKFTTTVGQPQFSSAALAVGSATEVTTSKMWQIDEESAEH